mmetsp:Transcript_17318/g.35608  ORF Transcript_17318/g.35608 Transcript_17318/m.35608 type:complete len:177 (+) Transcript_17318:209-739(+)|eukprot:CAMPEP_0201117794 /NCGR_PEP_ID=MMETSP0850-20130426/1836_1 /ASSEMBLY_ACC=CAM_ASM_000622 /TAXON_ID=183588 /ORGANISM="Pseudo-nitzschia fraudulenta, Strain WWA7" /LENGTH=176 /DNA_ID=CAMNT_0047382441 /DNA_START=173 /DNA_END=703 /DNA_ORIENTATION=+
MATFRNNIVTTNLSTGSGASTGIDTKQITKTQQEEQFDHKQMISEFLTNAESISSSSTEAIDAGAKTMTDVVTKSPEDRKRPMNKNDDPYYEGGRQDYPQRRQRYQDESLTHDDSVAIIHDQDLVRAVIAHDERLNKEVMELFDLDPFFREETKKEEEECDCHQIKDCLTGCMFLQ